MTAEGKCLNFKKELYFFSKLKADIGKKSKHPVVKENQPMKIVLEGWMSVIATFSGTTGRVFGNS